MRRPLWRWRRNTGLWASSFRDRPGARGQVDAIRVQVLGEDGLEVTPDLGKTGQAVFIGLTSDLAAKALRMWAISRMCHRYPQLEPSRKICNMVSVAALPGFSS